VGGTKDRKGFNFSYLGVWLGGKRGSSVKEKASRGIWKKCCAGGELRVDREGT